MAETIHSEEFSMNIPASFAGPDLRSLASIFPLGGDIPEYEYVPADEVPEPYHKLLVHEHHMTVTMEQHHGDLVNVVILDRKHDRDWYARKILLALQGNGRVVQFGLMRIQLQYCSEAVRREIIAGKTPLGRILIQHDVLRRIEPTAYLRVIPGPSLMKGFGLAYPRPTYGRLAYIHCNGKPAVELLEIVAPEEASVRDGCQPARRTP
jgi:chorismate-pyruvate lyase